MNGLISTDSSAELTLGSLFTDHMVLQQEHPIPVWGWGVPGGEVKVSLGRVEANTKVNGEGKWFLTLPPLAMGGPIELNVTDGVQSIVVEDVLIGEVWLCSGQSNMQFPLSETPGAESELEQASEFELVRLYQAPKTGADSPQGRMEASWAVSSPTSAGSFSAVAWHFAKELRRSERLNGVPIGLIDSSYGGTRTEAWIGKELLDERFQSEQLQDSFLGWKPSSMFNGMIAPILPYTIRGVLWYQGESNSDDPELFRDLFRCLVEDWRTRWDLPDLPFYSVQLPNYAASFGGHFFTQARETQLNLSQEIPNTAMAVSIDSGEPFDVHPPDKENIGQRLGLIARALAYDEDVVYSGPVFESMSIQGQRIRLRFDHVGSGLVSKDGGSELEGFAVCGEDGRFWDAEASIEGDEVVVSSHSVPNPVHVRYAWGGNPKASLYNKEGLPASPFRTDHFVGMEGEMIEYPGSYSFDSPTYEAEVDWDGYLTQLKVGGEEFLDASFDASRGLFFLDVFDTPHVFTRVTRKGPRILEAESLKLSVRYEFGDREIDLTLNNKTEDPQNFIAVLAPKIGAIQLDGKEILRPFINQPCSEINLYRGKSFVRLSGDARLRGPWSLFFQLWEVSLEPKEERRIKIEAGQSSIEERLQIVRNEIPEPKDITLVSPKEFQVFQRQTHSRGTVLLSGHIQKGAGDIEARIVGESLHGALSDEWFAVPVVSRTGEFNKEFDLPAGGWYRFELRATKEDGELAESSIERFGVGEVFVGAGQSNSTNSGEERTQPASAMVSTFDGKSWRLANDPQPGVADNTEGGSFWPSFGDSMHEKFSVPIGVAATGFGGTSVDQWLPGSDLYQFTLKRVHELGRQGFRALLWHQGESDAGMAEEEYYQKLRSIVLSSKADAGWEFPWFVAQATYLGPERPKNEAVRKAQARIWGKGIALPGPDTDTLTGENRENSGAGVHFSRSGLAAHGRLWADRVGEYVQEIEKEKTPPQVDGE